MGRKLEKKNGTDVKKVVLIVDNLRNHHAKIVSLFVTVIFSNSEELCINDL